MTAARTQPTYRSAFTLALNLNNEEAAERIPQRSFPSFRFEIDCVHCLVAVSASYHAVICGVT